MKESVNYDKYDYDYSTYWETRGYEQRAEEIALNNLLKSISGKRFIDIGGSYGRLTPLYASNFNEVVILDYSFETLVKYSESIKSVKHNARLVAANAYYMPFVKSSFDGGLMVRVLHHLSDQPQYLNELNRVLNRGSFFIQEYANKIHLKARLRAFRGNDKSLYNLEPYQQPSQGNFEGSDGEEVPFLNFHPEYIEQLMNDHNFAIDSKRGCSYLRSTPLANNTPSFFSSSVEKLSQFFFQSADISPSIFLRIKNIKRSEISYLNKPFEEILRCPLCITDNSKSPGPKDKNSGELKIASDRAICNSCSKTYMKKDGVWDFRV